MNRTALKFTLGIASLAAIAGLGLGISRLASMDSLQRFRPNREQKDPRRPTVFANNIEFTQYDGTRLIARGQVRELEATRSRDQVMLAGIQKGEYLTKDGKSVHFEAQQGVWNEIRKILAISTGARIWATDFDLKTASAVFESGKELLRISGKVTGKLFGGDVSAENMQIHLPTSTYEIGPVTWVGALQDDAGSKTRSKWTIKAKRTSRPVGDTEIWTEASATDGDIIVQADRIERNVKQDIMVATGHVRYFSRDANMTCTKATIYRKDKRALMEGAISMLIKSEGNQSLEVVPIEPLRPIVPDSIAASRPSAPKTEIDQQLDDEVRSGANRRKYPIQITCEKVDYTYAKGRRKAILTGAPQARQALPGDRWRAAWCTTALYDREAETLEMKSGSGKEVRIKTSLGDDLLATWFKVSTRENDDSYEAENLEGEVSVDDEDLKSEKDSTPPPAGSGSPRGRIGAR